MFRDSCSLLPYGLGVSGQPEVTALQSAASDTLEEPPCDLHKPVVLLIDDDADSLVLLQNILEQFICDIVCQSSGQAALAYALQSPPDLIVLDIWMPDVDGLDIARTLRQHNATHAIPIAAVTALASQRDREEILQAGCTHYLSKPFLLEDIEVILKQYLKLRDA